MRIPAPMVWVTSPDRPRVSVKGEETTYQAALLVWTICFILRNPMIYPSFGLFFLPLEFASFSAGGSWLFEVMLIGGLTISCSRLRRASI